MAWYSCKRDEVGVESADEVGGRKRKSSEIEIELDRGEEKAKTRMHVRTDTSLTRTSALSFSALSSSSTLRQRTLGSMNILGCCSNPAYENVFLKATPRIRRESYCTTTPISRDVCITICQQTERAGLSRLGKDRRRESGTNLHTTTGNLLGPDQILVQVVLVEAEDSVDDHLGEEGLLGVDELRGHGGGGELDEMRVEDSVTSRVRKSVRL
jgi:hypothetical protein